MVLNDFDLDANEIMSWLRGDTNHLNLNLTPKKEKESTDGKPSENVQYTIKIEKQPLNAPKKQYCDNCYEKLPTRHVGGKEGVEPPSLPGHLSSRIVSGTVAVDGAHTLSGKTILYCCNNYYVDYNFGLQCAIYLASTLSVPLILVILRDVEEYQYPFSMHTVHLLHHLCEFQTSLIDLNITPLLVFTSSFSSAFTHLIADLHPVYVVTEPNSDIRHQLEMRLLLKEYSNVLVVSNSMYPQDAAKYSSPFLDPTTFTQLSSRIHSFIHSSPPPSPRISNQLDLTIQFRVAYSLTKEESFFSCSEASLLPDMKDSILILPPFLTSLPPPSDNSQDFCYGKERQVQNIVVNWGDIIHEMKFYKNRSFFQLSLEERLRSTEWYYPFFRGSVQGTNVYRISGALRSGMVSAYRILEIYPEGEQELIELCAVESFYHSFFLNNLSSERRMVQCRCDHAERPCVSPVSSRDSLSGDVNQFSSSHSRR